MSDNPEEAACYLRFIRIYIDLATQTVLKVFMQLTPDRDVDLFFASSEVKNKLKTMQNGNILKKKEYDLVTRAHLRPESFDISLLITLLIHVYRSRLQAPKNGWKTPVDTSDHTIAADLLRLREIRNKIVAHQPRARLERFKFKRLWDDVENILVRLTQQVDSSSEESLRENIQKYATIPLDTTAVNYQMYLDVLQEWFDDVLKLQEKIEETLKRMEELNLYFKTKPARYSRYVRLLFDGGKLVLHGLLKREMSKRQQTLQVILQGKRSDLTNKIDDEVLIKHVFPNAKDMTETSVDIDNWDIAVLACVIICLLNDNEDSDEDIISDVTVVLEARRKYAEAALAALDNERFTTMSGKLLSSISFLCSEVDSESRRNCKRIIANFNESEGNQNDDDKKYFEELVRHGPGIKNINDIYNDTLNGLKKYVRRMEEDGIPFLNYHILDLKIVTLGSNAQKVKVVEDVVATVWQAALERSGNTSDFPAVRRAIDNILDDIRGIPDVEVANVERHCILFFLKCMSWRGIFQMVEYFESSRFKQHLQTISVEMSLVYDETINIQGHLTLECLWEILNPSQEKEDSDHTLSIPIKCSSVTGMREVLKVLNNEQTSNRLNEIADTLSHNEEGKMSLSVFPDVYGFTGVFEETDSDNSGSGQFRFLEDAVHSQGHKEDQQFLADSSTGNILQDPLARLNANQEMKIKSEGMIDFNTQPLYTDIPSPDAVPTEQSPVKSMPTEQSPVKSMPTEQSPVKSTVLSCPSTSAAASTESKAVDTKTRSETIHEPLTDETPTKKMRYMYSEEEKMYVRSRIQNGEKISDVAKALQIPCSTISTWIHSEKRPVSIKRKNRKKKALKKSLIQDNPSFSDSTHVMFEDTIPVRKTKKYSEEEKDNALEWIRHGKKTSDVAKALQIPCSTISTWKQSERQPVSIETENRKEDMMSDMVIQEYPSDLKMRHISVKGNLDLCPENEGAKDSITRRHKDDSRKEKNEMYVQVIRTRVLQKIRDGENVSDVSKKLRIPEFTVHNWVKKESDTTQNIRNDEQIGSLVAETKLLSDSKYESFEDEVPIKKTKYSEEEKQYSSKQSKDAENLSEVLVSKAWKQSNKMKDEVELVDPLPSFVTEHRKANYLNPIVHKSPKKRKAAFIKRNRDRGPSNSDFNTPGNRENNTKRKWKTIGEDISSMRRDIDIPIFDSLLVKEGDIIFRMIHAEQTRSFHSETQDSNYKSTTGDSDSQLKPVNTSARTIIGKDKSVEMFFQFCEEYLKNAVRKFTNRLRRKYTECDEEFKQSNELFDEIVYTRGMITSDSLRFFAHLRTFYNFLKKNKNTDTIN